MSSERSELNKHQYDVWNNDPGFKREADQEKKLKQLNVNGIPFGEIILVNANYVPGRHEALPNEITTKSTKRITAAHLGKDKLL